MPIEWFEWAKKLRALEKRIDGMPISAWTIGGQANIMQVLYENMLANEPTQKRA